ncbi:hypothetical protein HY948_01590 [Candidatus Gottesmanbacteria bacterium]|nr:hypothetical protein [Candidatus Gottesmanbacteria bacterium]
MAETEEYLCVIKKIEETQEAKGDAGCYAELYPVLRGAATLLIAYQGILGETEFNRRMNELGGILDSLPDLHDESVLIKSYAKIRQLTT